LDEKLGDNEDTKNELEKESEKDQPSSNVTSSQYQFKIKAKVDIKPCQGAIDVVKLNQWLQ